LGGGDASGGAIPGAALAMAFNRQPHYFKGVLLVGDAGGLVNPFNGEGIAYAMESGQIAADVIVQARATDPPAPRGTGPPPRKRDGGPVRTCVHAYRSFRAEDHSVAWNVRWICPAEKGQLLSSTWTDFHAWFQVCDL
jgi:hypothetical protein